MRKDVIEVFAREGHHFGGIYIHVPFCLKKCDYCAFYSSTNTSLALQEAWLQGIENELADFITRHAIRRFSALTLYIGGGTPTALDPAILRKLFAMLRRHIPNFHPFEATCEANPGTLTPEKLDILLENGITRLSLGLQSINTELLQDLGRIYDGYAAFDAFAAARAAGFQNISVDLIYGVPCFPPDLFLEGVELVVRELAPEHISAYCLELESGTPFYHRFNPFIIAREDWRAWEEDQFNEYTHIRRRLKLHGYRHYELSSFAKPGKESNHNLIYWSGDNYLGLGPAAHSYWLGTRWGNTATRPDAWQRAFTERLTPEAAARETLVMGLRRTKGWKDSTFQETTGFSYMDLCGKEIEELVQEGLLTHKPRLRLTTKAYFISDTVFSRLI